MIAVLRKLWEYFRSQHQLAEPSTGEPGDSIVISERQYDEYAYVIGNELIYFNDLPLHERWRFANRVHQFKSKRKFHFVGLEEKDAIKTLVSAAAVQVTFGLQSYMLQHFENVYVLADAYKMDADDELFIGHVSPEGIYLSWRHFLHGYRNRKDNVNVAIHEMAHALLYNNFFAEYGMDQQFRANYDAFSSTTGPILASAIANRRSYLRSYAFSNLHEFWAVSVEAFFEGPADLKAHMPELYRALCRVLNQDPCTNAKVLTAVA